MKRSFKKSAMKMRVLTIKRMTILRTKKMIMNQGMMMIIIRFTFDLKMI